MKVLNLTDVFRYVEDNIKSFHDKKLSSLETLKLERVLQRKNPYLFKAKHILTSQDIIKALVDAHISSNEETIFGDWLEGLAIFINSKVYGGWKSGITGIDLEFDNKDKRYLVTIKSGPNWGNSSQIARMKTDFSTAQRTLRTSNSGMVIICVNGCCYGRDNKPDKATYFKYCGQRFWKFISNNESLYTDLIEPLGYKAKENDELFVKAYANQINKFTSKFSQLFCTNKGEIDWEKIVKYNSRSEKYDLPKAHQKI